MTSSSSALCCAEEHELRGFRSADLRRILGRDEHDPVQRRRNRAASGRLLVAKIPRTRRWNVTPLGHSCQR